MAACLNRAMRCVVTGSLLLLPLWAASGCSQGVVNAQRTLDTLHAQGAYSQAATYLDTPGTIQAYEADRPRGRDAVLWEMERGAVALATSNPQRAIHILNRAEERTRYNYERQSGDILATWVFNDTAPEYLAAAYEDQYVNVFKILAYLDLDQIDGKATAEARRFSDKARYLRDFYGRYYQALSKESGDRTKQGAPRLDDERLRSYARTDAPMDFIESPLGAYLSAISFLKTSGEREAQRGAGLRLLDSIRQQGDLIGNVDPAPFEALPEESPSNVNTLVVAFAGRGPTKDKEEFGPIFLWYTTIHIVLPRLIPHESTVVSGYLESSDGTKVPLHLVEDMSRVARENFERQMPAIYQRTMLRVFAKAAAVGAATVVTDESVRGSDGGSAAAAQIAVRALGFLYMWLTEDADVRGWTMLPGRAFVAHTALSPGAHNVRVVYTTRSGTTISQPWRQIDVNADGLATIVEHCPN